MGKHTRERKKTKSRSKQDKNDKKHRKEKKNKRSRRKEVSDTGSSTESDGGHVDVNTQLAMGRTAARAAREILAYSYTLKEELRELFRQLDTDEALDISGVPDEFVRTKLCTLFDNLVQLKRISAGQYLRQKSAAPVLSFIAPLLEETPSSLAAYAHPSLGSKPGSAGRQPGSQDHGLQPSLAERSSKLHEEHQPAGAVQLASRSAVDRYAEDSAWRNRAQQMQQTEGSLQQEHSPMLAQLFGPCSAPQDLQEGLVESSDNGAGEDAGVRCSAGGNDGGDGAVETGGGGPDAAEVLKHGVDVRHMLGPSMPSMQQLEAAAQMVYSLEEEEKEEGLDGLLVGPPPPELEDEMSAASMDQRSAEVVRVSKVLTRHATALQGSTAARAVEEPPDPYEVLGLADDALPADVKKRYWRLSLMIHPDKCDHAQAHDAFQAVARAAKELQDVTLRQAVDERRQEKVLRAEFEAMAANAERQRQWRVLRGEATAADLAGPSMEQYGGPSRDSWMTELPPERRAGTALPSLTNQMAFSKAGVKPRGDTSAWTLTPVQRAAQLEQGPGQGPLMLTVAGNGPSQQPSQRIAAATELYNSKMRKKSLLEQHLDKQQQQSAKKKRKKGEKGQGSKHAKPDWDPAQHPWRPFDREKDLGPSLSGPANPQNLLKNTKALSSRFTAG